MTRVTFLNPMLVGIEQLSLSPLRRQKTVPRLPDGYVEQIKRFGQWQPVLVRQTASQAFEILSNAEAWLGVQRAGLHQVDILVRQDIPDDLASTLVNAEGRTDPISEAETFQDALGRVGESGKKVRITDLARERGLSRSYVAHALRLLSLPEDLQLALRSGRLKVGHAKALLSVKAPTLQATLAEHVMSRGLSVHQCEALVRDRLRNPQAATENAKSSGTQQLERDLGDLVGCPIRIDESQGKLVIDYCGDLDILDGVLQRLGYVA